MCAASTSPPRDVASLWASFPMPGGLKTAPIGNRQTSLSAGMRDLPQTGVAVNCRTGLTVFNFLFFRERRAVRCGFGSGFRVAIDFDPATARSGFQTFKSIPRSPATAGRPRSDQIASDEFPRGSQPLRLPAIRAAARARLLSPYSRVAGLRGRTRRFPRSTPNSHPASPRASIAADRTLLQ